MVLFSTKGKVVFPLPKEVLCRVLDISKNAGNEQATVEQIGIP